MPQKLIFFLLGFTVFVTTVTARFKIECHHDRCSVCKRSGCELTCFGNDCTSCPTGSCCNGGNCNSCVGSSCCEHQECNDCVGDCRERCHYKYRARFDCDRHCSRECLKSESLMIVPNITTINKNNYNVTTVIKLTNLINQTNIIDTPVNVNVTNQNNITIHANDFDIPVDLPVDGNVAQNCCSIVHPEYCHQVSYVLNLVCFRRKHYECSSLCVSGNIYIRQDPTVFPTSIRIQAFPYTYNGPFVVEDCSKCYSCEKENCTEEPACNAKCKESIISDQFYNVPYHKN